MTPGSKSSEFKATTIAGGLGVMPVLLDMLQGGQALTENIKITLIVCVTLIVVSYNLSRGFSKKEQRGDRPTPPPTA